MRQVFLDTSYIQALADPGDNLHERAKAVSRTLTSSIVTSEMVLTELLNALSNRGIYLRQTAIRITKDLYKNSSIEIVPQTNKQFQEAFLFYQKRLDKGYSLTDCASIIIMLKKDILDVLTFDRHFQQEGFNALLRD